MRRAAWAGLQDSMPRAALLSIHARVEGAGPSAWADPSLVQVWGPRYQVYVVAARDLAVFTLGRLPDSGKTRRTAEVLATRLRLPRRGCGPTTPGRRWGCREHPSLHRLDGSLAIRWRGTAAHRVDCPAAEIIPAEATLELARRYLHIFGPAGPEAFGKWAGIGAQKSVGAFDDLRTELIPVSTPSGDAFMLARDEPTIREVPAPAAAARLLPSGDAYTLHATSEEGAPRAGSRPTSRPVDAACVARRASRGRGGRRDVAPRPANGDDSGLAVALANSAGGSPRRGRIVAAARHRWADRRPLELTIGPDAVSRASQRAAGRLKIDRRATVRRDHLDVQPRDRRGPWDGRLLAPRMEALWPAGAPPRARHGPSPSRGRPRRNRPGTAVA